MGYFDSIANSAFKTKDDGQRLFYPWGTISHGYVIPSEEEYEKLLRDYKYVSLIAILIGIVAIIYLQNFLSIIAFMVVFIVAYMLWVRIRCRNLTPSLDKLTVGQSTSGQPRAFNTILLWVLDLASLAFVVLGVVILVINPGNWLIALGTILFFGVCAVVLSRMIIIKQRGAHTQN
jgi:hypothetical protein